MLKPIVQSLTCLTPLLGGAALLVSGCAGSGSGMAGAEGETLDLDFGRNQVLAWVDRAEAPTPTVARAMTLVALGQAKRATESELCAGDWVFSGDVEEAGAPATASAPPAVGAYSAWHYRIAWDPQLPDCEQVTAQSYYRTLSRHLPDWIMVQTETPVAVYHRGEAVFNRHTDPFMLALQTH